VRAEAGPASHGEGGFHVDAEMFEVDCSDVDDRLINEIFGPTTVVVRYRADSLLAQVRSVVDALPASLTATIQHGGTEAELVDQLTSVVRQAAGRIVYNGFPTGVAVSWAQNHGGPWPATNALHTSVGATAIRRFLRPLTFQNAPESALPLELCDDYTGIPRRIDGALVLAAGAPG
jgi:NADP-dependent aldehyde dehydrogenase